MKVLLVGEGAREHAIAVKLQESGAKVHAVCKKNHPGIREVCEKSNGKFSYGQLSPEAVQKFAKENGIELGFVSPDGLLAEGYTDAIEGLGIACASPTKEAAKLEWDKGFARNLLAMNEIEGLPQLGIFEDYKSAAEFIDKVGEVAVKPAGLTAGKGVKISGEHLKDPGEAKAYAKEILESSPGGLSKVVIEERLIGEEFTLQAFCDGKTIAPMPLVQDHKRAFEGDIGPNTGGMGSYSMEYHLLPFVSYSDYENAIAIMKKTVNSLYSSTGTVFRGILYGQFILTKKGLKLIEYNARFGDPEAMNVMTVLDDDLAEIMLSMANGKLRKSVKFRKMATVCKYLVPEGYPGTPAADSKIGIPKINERFYYASVYEQDNAIYTTGSRAIGVVAAAHDVYEAEKRVEQAISKFTGKLFHRKDIGTRELLESKKRKLVELGII